MCMTRHIHTHKIEQMYMVLTQETKHKLRVEADAKHWCQTTHEPYRESHTDISHRMVSITHCSS